MQLRLSLINNKMISLCTPGAPEPLLLIPKSEVSNPKMKYREPHYLVKNGRIDHSI